MSSTEDEQWEVTAFTFQERRLHAIHHGPSFLARTLGHKTLKDRRDFLIDQLRYPDDSLYTFEELHEASRPAPHQRYPANTYEIPDIRAKLSELPMAQQPSRGWEWFCDKFHIDSLGVSAYWEDQHSRLQE